MKQLLLILTLIASGMVSADGGTRIREYANLDHEHWQLILEVYGDYGSDDWTLCDRFGNICRQYDTNYDADFEGERPDHKFKWSNLAIYNIKDHDYRCDTYGAERPCTERNEYYARKAEWKQIQTTFSNCMDNASDYSGQIERNICRASKTAQQFALLAVWAGEDS